MIKEPVSGLIVLDQGGVDILSVLLLEKTVV